MNILHLIAVAAFISSTSGTDVNYLVDLGLDQTFNNIRSICPNQEPVLKQFRDCVKSIKVDDIGFCGQIQDQFNECQKPLVGPMMHCKHVRLTDGKVDVDTLSKVLQFVCENSQRIKALTKHQENCIMRKMETKASKCLSDLITSSTSSLNDGGSFFSPETCRILGRGAECMLQELAICRQEAVYLIRGMSEIVINANCRAILEAEKLATFESSSTIFTTSAPTSLETVASFSRTSALSTTSAPTSVKTVSPTPLKRSRVLTTTSAPTSVKTVSPTPLKHPHVPSTTSAPTSVKKASPTPLKRSRVLTTTKASTILETGRPTVVNSSSVLTTTSASTILEIKSPLAINSSSVSSMTSAHVIFPFSLVFVYKLY